MDVEPRGAHLSSEGPGGRAGGQPAGRTLRPSNTTLEVRQLPSGLKGGDRIHAGAVLLFAPQMPVCQALFPAPGGTRQGAGRDWVTVKRAILHDQPRLEPRLEWPEQGGRGFTGSHSDEAFYDLASRSRAC